MSILELQLDQQPLEVNQLAARIKEVQANLLQQTPGLSTALADIHRMLQQHEEMIHFLDDEDMKKLHQAHELFKQHHLVQSSIAKTGKKKIDEKRLMSL